MGKNLFLAASGEFQILKKTPPLFFLYFLDYKKGVQGQGSLVFCSPHEPHIKKMVVIRKRVYCPIIAAFLATQCDKNKIYCPALAAFIALQFELGTPIKNTSRL